MLDYRAASPPTSDVFSDDMDSVSVKDKTLLKKAVQKHNNNNNFKAGYMPVQNSKPVFRGRKTFAFWTLVGLLFILAIGNLILTMTILGVLKLGQGMQNIELVPEDQVIKFYGDIDLDHIYKKDGMIEGYGDEPVEITATDSPIIINLASRSGRPLTKLRIDKNETVFKGISSFDVKNSHGESIFTLNDPVLNSLKNANNFKTKHIQTNKISSPSDESLNIAGDLVNLRGAEGTKIEGREIVWRADQDIYLKSINGSIVLSGKEGIFIDVSRIPIAKLNSNNYVTAQFKVCVCMPEGKLFRIPVANPNDRVYCHHVNMSPPHNPCI